MGQLMKDYPFATLYTEMRFSIREKLAIGSAALVVWVLLIALFVL
jgi:hypothetical protein